MKLSKYFYVTLRETPSDATMPSHIFLMRGGYIKPVSTGIYSMMPIGYRVIQKIVNIIREEMNKIGGIEVDLPVVQTAELWSESGRYQAIGEELLRFKLQGPQQPQHGARHDARRSHDRPRALRAQQLQAAPGDALPVQDQVP